MKKILLITLVCTVAAWADAQTTNLYSANPAAAIPGASAIGLTETFNVSGVPGTVANVQVGLDITGGFNGNLYAYLEGPDGEFAVLLNDVGVSAANPAGYSDAGFDITLDDSGANIHDYQSVGDNINGAGQLTGIWAPDGRDITPGSIGSAYDAAATTANLDLFDGNNANGMWTLFVADLGSGGGTPQLATWSLNIVAVPEPSALALSGLGGLGMLVLIFRRRR